MQIFGQKWDIKLQLLISTIILFYHKFITIRTLEHFNFVSSKQFQEELLLFINLRKVFKSYIYISCKQVLQINIIFPLPVTMNRKIKPLAKYIFGGHNKATNQISLLIFPL